MKSEEILSKLQHRNPSILGSEQFFKYAILLPLIEIDEEFHVLFEVRSSELRRQPGEICFPGGKIEKYDTNETDTAIRETMEELGIQRESIQGVSPLDYMVSAFGTIIYPHVGMITDYDKIKANPTEVAEIFTVPLTYFQQTPPDIYKIHFKVEPEEKFPFHLIAGGENYNWQARAMDEYFYYYGDKVIWGLTARILKHFLDIFNSK